MVFAVSMLICLHSINGRQSKLCCSNTLKMVFTPAQLSLLAEEFKAAPDDRRGQVILTTHSPRLLDEFDADQIRVVELEEYETRIGPVSQKQREAIQEDLLDAGELLTVDPAVIDPISESTGA